MPTTEVDYPHAGTKAEAILQHIRENPGTSRNAIISTLSLNPSVVRRYVQVLIDRKLIEDVPDDQGFHHYTEVKVK